MKKTMTVFCLVVSVNLYSATLSEKNAIDDLYNSTCNSGCTWAYNQEVDPCDNDGNEIVCRDGKVVYFNLGYSSLSGRIPASFENLVNLEFIGMHNNGLVGIDADLGKLSNLEEIQISNNNITGVISSTINSATLTNVDIEQNNFTGSLTDFSAMTDLEKLTLSGNIITGNISSISHLDKIDYLTLSGVNITGSLSSLTNMIDLNQLDLEGSNITGSLSDISSLTNLSYVNLSELGLAGSLSDILTLTKLFVLYLSDNNISGVIPPEFADLNLGKLSLSNNNLSGDIPEMSGLSSLFLGYNDWNCPIDDYSNWSSHSDYSTSLRSCEQKTYIESINELYDKTCKENCTWDYDTSLHPCANGGQDGIVCTKQGDLFTEITNLELNNKHLSGIIPNTPNVSKGNLPDYVALAKNNWDCPIEDYSGWGKNTDFNAACKKDSSGGSFKFFIIALLNLSCVFRYLKFNYFPKVIS